MDLAPPRAFSLATRGGSLVRHEKFHECFRWENHQSAALGVAHTPWTKFVTRSRQEISWFFYSSCTVSGLPCEAKGSSCTRLT